MGHLEKQARQESEVRMGETWVTIVVALIAASPGIWAIWQQHKKDVAAAEKDVTAASDTITNSAIKLVEPLKKRIDELEIQVNELEAKIDQQDIVIHKLTVGSKKLYKQLIERNIAPIWNPASLEEQIN